MGRSPELAAVSKAVTLTTPQENVSRNFIAVMNMHIAVIKAFGDVN